MPPVNIPAPPAPPAVSQRPVSPPSLPHNVPGPGNGVGNGLGNNGFPGSGPGDAHLPPSGNTSGPGSSLRGGSGNGGGTCDGLCAHLGQQPTASVPQVSAQATPTPVTITPTPTPAPAPAPITLIAPPSSPSAPATTTRPTIPSLPSTPSFSSTSSSRPVGLAGAGGSGAGGGRAIPLPLITGSAGLTLPGGTIGALPSGGLGLGTLAPATSAIGLAPGAAAVPAATTTGTRPTGHHHSSSSHSSGISTVLFIPHFINHIPEGVWIALAASLLLAAVGAGAALVSRRRAAEQAGELAAVSAAALTDPLTGVLNRRGFIEAVERELARARRYHHPFVLAYVDVRGLKTVNDTEGHLAGDTLLTSVAALLTECARADDVVGRLGGDELGLLLVEQTPEAAKAVTRRIAAQVAARREAMRLSVPWDLTVGSAAFPQDGQSVDELLDTADRRLYQQRGIHLAGSR